MDRTRGQHTSGIRLSIAKGKLVEDCVAWHTSRNNFILSEIENVQCEKFNVRFVADVTSTVGRLHMDDLLALLQTE